MNNGKRTGPPGVSRPSASFRPPSACRLPAQPVVSPPLLPPLRLPASVPPSACRLRAGLRSFVSWGRTKLHHNLRGVSQMQTPGAVTNLRCGGEGGQTYCADDSSSTWISRAGGDARSPVWVRRGRPIGHLFSSRPRIFWEDCARWKRAGRGGRPRGKEHS